MNPILQVLIVDDHPLFRLGLKYALQADGFEICGEAETGQQAIDYCAHHPLDVVILDIKMRDGDGIMACEQITALKPDLVVVMLTTFQEPALIQASRRAGAKGFLSKETDPSQLAKVIRQIVQDPERDWLPEVIDLPQLTPRELTVLQLMQQGLANKQIARQLGLRADTVKEYVSAVYRKFGVSDRVSAIAKAQSLGLLGSSTL